MPDRRGVAGARRIAQIASQAGAGRSDHLSDFGRRFGFAAASPLRPLRSPKSRRPRDCCCIAAPIFTRSTAYGSTSRGSKAASSRAWHIPATLVTLILSDVIGDDLDVIGSGPTVPDRSTFADARAIFEKYRIWNKLPLNSARAPVFRSRGNSQARRQNLREDAQRDRGQQCFGRGRGGDGSASPRVPHVGSVDIRRRAKRVRWRAFTLPSPRRFWLRAARFKSRPA